MKIRKLDVVIAFAVATAGAMDTFPSASWWLFGLAVLFGTVWSYGILSGYRKVREFLSNRLGVKQ
ncbi:MAG: hypothetical protein KW806_01965 [Candidatus Yanofskybacteria bacterium]|nr:hypothetical protein [Candidatus Yanofskybacteria bacterium]